MKRLLTILLILLSATAFAQTKYYCCVIKGTTTGGGGGGTVTYTVEKVVRFNLSNEYELGSQQPASPKWNLCNPTLAQMQLAGGYVNASLVDETGVAATGWSITNLTGFGATTGSAPAPTVANSGIYPDAIVTYGWVMPSSGADQTIRITGLNPAKSYQIHLLANDEGWKNAFVTTYVGAATSAAVNANTNYGASTDDEYKATYLCHVKNAHCTSGGVLDIGINTSNTNNPNIVALVIQQTNIDNPN